jgi:formylglycine-generating enzyme required for sulfatase activity/N-acetylneuraminic acid mutarotase
MKFRALLIAGFLLSLGTGTVAAEWVVRADIPHFVYGHAGAVAGGKLYIIGGCETADWTVASTRLQIYDPATDSWSQGRNLPIELGWPMVTVYDGLIFVFGGMRNGAVSTDQAWSYDPAADAWSPQVPLPVKAMNGVAIAVTDSIYVGLGYQRTDQSPEGVVKNFHEFYRYSPADKNYTRLADAPEGACYAAVGSYEGRIYVVHGAEYETGFKKMEDYGWADGALKYDLAEDAWTKLNVPRVQQRVFFLTQCTSSVQHEEKLFVAGGQSFHRRTNTASYFDMSRELFFQIPELPGPRCCGGGGVAGDELILAGGFWGVGQTADPAAPTWLLKVTSLPAPGQIWSNSAGMPLAYVPAGKFIRGSGWEQPNRSYDEHPHPVRLTKPFRIGTSEVTQGQWKAVMGEGRPGFSNDNLPVTEVSWRDAVAFCEKLSALEGKKYRLPTEAEWEYACRAGSPGDFSGGSRLEELGWFADNSNELQPVGTRKPNAWGLYDMHGNVAEWCADFYQPEYPKEEVVNPAGPAQGAARVLRGGSFEGFARSCRSAARSSAPPSYQLKDTGFRVVLEE